MIVRSSTVHRAIVIGQFHYAMTALREGRHALYEQMYFVC